MRLLANQRRHFPTLSALCCALGGMLCLGGALAAQEYERASSYFPESTAYTEGDVWTEPPVYVPVLPLDLPPISPAEYQRPYVQRPYGDVAPVAYQAPLPRPESPPAPITGAETLEPIPADYTFPTPSCLNGGGCGMGGCGMGGCGSCGGCDTCEPCVARTRAGRFACELYRAICCPDPCYEPMWTGIANASFWVESARPITQTRYRWDASFDLIYPDRAEFLWPKVGALGPAVAPQSLTLHELSMYTEIASGGFSFFIDTPYRSFDPTGPGAHAAGFSDISMGTKSVMFDCELLQITFQFKTIIPSGIGLKGLGTQHVSLEPSLLMALNLSPDSYVQAQVSEWIPISADASAAGAILHYHASLNHVLWRWQPSVPIIGTLEANGWSFQDGLYTDPVLGPQSASGETYVSAGPGIRVVVCDKVDFGVGTAVSLTENHWGEQTLRSEFRWRY